MWTRFLQILYNVNFFYEVLVKNFVTFSLCFFFMVSTLCAEREIKVLVLVIASDDQPVYIEFQKVWRAYMHLDPRHVEAYFIRSDPELRAPYEIQGDVIWCKGKECLEPGILQKTVFSLECLAERLDEFDYVLRTNLSSFYVFPVLLEFLETLPRNQCYAAVPYLCELRLYFGSGAGFIMSTDTAKILIKKKKELLRMQQPDDVAIGLLFFRHGIPLLPTPRMELLNLKSWEEQRGQLSPDQFHFRVKNSDQDKRYTEDVIIQKELLQKYYNITLR